MANDGSMAGQLDGVTLASLADLDVSDIQGRTIGDVVPEVVGKFRCTKSTLDELKDAAGKVTFFVARFDWQIVEVQESLDKNYSPEWFIGKKHQETRFINLSNMDTMEFLIGFLKELGVSTKGKLGAIVASVAEQNTTVFGMVKHTLDKKLKKETGEDRWFANLAKIKPLPAGA
jgi:hypothetical protein